MVGFFVFAVAASISLLVALEILKLRRFRFRQVSDATGAAAIDQEEIDLGVARELETGSFAAIDPETGELREIDPETGEFDVVERAEP
jgi:hypothetical protein